MAPNHLPTPYGSHQMIVTKVELKNWRNFKSIVFDLADRTFVIGPNASGKSNLLDMFCFLRDVAQPSGGGLQKAVADRGGITKLRCLAARKDSEISIKVTLLQDDNDQSICWQYHLAFKAESQGKRRVMISTEHVVRDDCEILSRPTKVDCEDEDRLTQTSLEQTNANQDFRKLASFFGNVHYLHLVPQLLKFSQKIGGNPIENDPLGQGFMERIARTPKHVRKSRLSKIEKALQAAVPQLRELQFKQEDDTGKPHLEARYEHWRPNAGWQREDQFSDGTLRLLALCWSLLDGDSLLLLEEPELSLNDAIVEKIPALISSIQRKSKSRRQVLISTHSNTLLKDPGIDARSVLVLRPATEGTTIVPLTDEDRIQIEAGFGVNDVLLAKTRSTVSDQLPLL